MKLLVTSAGHVNWNNTRQSIVASATFAGGQDDFGAGNENTATCPGCNRTLPMVCMHLDHILSKARHSISVASNSVSATLYDSTAPHNVSQTFNATVSGGTVTISRLGTVYPSSQPARSVRRLSQVLDVVAILNTNDAWENDFSNLQFLCMSCNTSKGARDFDVAFAGRGTRPLG